VPKSSATEDPVELCRAERAKVLTERVDSSRIEDDDDDSIDLVEASELSLFVEAPVAVLPPAPDCAEDGGKPRMLRGSMSYREAPQRDDERKAVCCAAALLSALSLPRCDSRNG